jgi:hypothetical protein
VAALLGFARDVEVEPVQEPVDHRSEEHRHHREERDAAVEPAARLDPLDRYEELARR